MTIIYYFCSRFVDDADFMYWNIREVEILINSVHNLNEYIYDFHDYSNFLYKDKIYIKYFMIILERNSLICYVCSGQL